MESIYIISNGISTLQREVLTTSSSKYEANLALALSEFTNVKIFSSAVNSGFRTMNGSLELIGTRSIRSGKGIKRVVNNAKELYSAIKSSSHTNSIIIFWGYDSFAVIQMLLIKLFLHIPVISFIYDSHKPAISGLSFVKKGIINFRFQFGKLLSNLLSGYLFFQEDAAKEVMVVRKPFLVTKPGVSYNCNYHHTEKEKFIVSFSGTFSELNGIDALLDSLEENYKECIEINVCGYGPLLDQVMEADKKYEFFHYKGVLNENELYELYNDSDLLLNLRRLDPEVMKYAFPSKVFEYIGTESPLLSTAVWDDKCFLENIYMLSQVDGKTVTEYINYACENAALGKKKAMKLKDYIEKKYNQRIVAYDIYQFLEKICEEQ